MAAFRGTASRTAHARPSVACRASKRGVVMLPGLGNSSADYGKFAEVLQDKYNCDVEIAEVARIDWARNAAGLTDARYWQGTLSPRPTVDWYLNRIDRALKALKERGHTSPATMLTHSAGGWLGRVYLNDFGCQGVDRLVSLGSPHLPPAAGAAGIVDQTRGILTFCEDNFPGCHHEEVKYVTVASQFIKGVKWGDAGTWQQRIAGAGYKQVCGSADVWGDGIVPVPSAHLEGAINVDIEGAYHSPLGASEDRTWYGDEEHIEKWIDYAVA
eukprot:jgi/Ulvmu1/7803/UM004_0032.1